MAKKVKTIASNISYRGTKEDIKALAALAADKQLKLADLTWIAVQRVWGPELAKYKKGQDPNEHNTA